MTLRECSIIIALTLAVPARASLTLTGGSNEACKFKATFDWTVTPPEIKSVPPPRPGLWTADIVTKTGGGALAPVSVTAEITHDTNNPPCNPPPPGANPDSIFLKLTNVVPVVGQSGSAFLSKTAAGQVAHAPAVDLGFLRTRVTVGNSGVMPPTTIEVAGLHQGPAVPFVQPSYHNDLGTPETVTITPDYRLNDPQKTIVPGDPVSVDIPAGGDLKADPLMPKIRKGRFQGTLASYEMAVSGSPVSDTTLAFLGQVDGSFSELDLAAAIELFVGDAEFFVPSLRSATDPALSLYVGADLTQWLGSETKFNPFDTFNLLSGVSDALPGLLVGLSPVTLGADGFQTADPYTGEVIVAGRIDGRDVPEPRSLMLLVTALALAAPSTRRFARLRAA